MTDLPDFLICGAARSGTTLLRHLLERHPEITLAGPMAPEPKFFARQTLYARGLDWYRATYFPARTHPCQGEKSTAYMDEPLAAHRIARDLPGIKLIFILREPGLRAWSNWKLSRRTGLETLDFATAIASEDARTAALEGEMAAVRPFSYIARSRYAEILQHYRAQFAPAQMFVARYEDLVTSPTTFLIRLHQFLGVTPRPQDGENPPIVNEAAGDPADAATLLAIRAACIPSNHLLARWYGAEFTWDV